MSNLELQSLMNLLLSELERDRTALRIVLDRSLPVDVVAELMKARSMNVDSTVRVARLLSELQS